MSLTSIFTLLVLMLLIPAMLFSALWALFEGFDRKARRSSQIKNDKSSIESIRVGRKIVEGFRNLGNEK